MHSSVFFHSNSKTVNIEIARQELSNYAFLYRWSRSCDSMSNYLYGATYVDTSQRTDGYMYLDTADPGYSSNYRIPGTLQNYRCKSVPHTIILTRNKLFKICIC